MSSERNAPRSSGAGKEKKVHEERTTVLQGNYTTAGEGQSTRLAITRFKNKYDKSVARQETMPWQDVVSLLNEHKQRIDKDGPLFAPAKFRDGGTRCDADVEELSMLVLDFDDGTPPKDLTPAWEKWEYVIYSTHSHMDDGKTQKWRAVFPLTRAVPAKEWEATYTKLAFELGKGHADLSCGNTGRMFYLPSCPKERARLAFAEHHEGKWLDPDEVPALARGGDYATLDVVKWFKKHGAYLRPLARPGMHAVVCPWKHEHTTESSDTSTVVWEAKDGYWPQFCCKHNHCRERRIKDVLAKWPDADAFCAKEFTPKPRPDEAGQGEGRGGGRSNVATALVALAEAAGVDVWQASNGEQYASVPVGEHTEHLSLDSEAFRAWLEYRFYQEEGRVATGGVDEALLVLRFKAMAGPKHPIYTRIAEHEGAVYIDLADEEWRAVRVTPAGWEVVSNPPVRFRRPNGLLPLPTPERGGRLDEMRRFINVTDEEWPLVAAWMVAALGPSGPYPVLILGGEQGSAKSTTARAIKRLLDPHTVDLRKESRDPRNLAIAANNTRILALDNLSGLAPWLSDYLCTLSTGGGYAIRKNYTDNEETLFNTQAPVILNGIGEIATRSDLLSRALMITCPPIPDTARRAEKPFWEDFKAAAPRLLGAVLDALAGALAKQRDVQLAGLPRMADFAILATAAARAGAFDEAAFWRAYDDNRENAHAIALEASPVAQALMALIEDQVKGEWKSTPSVLLDELRRYASDEALRSRAWPQSPRGLTAALTRLAPNLRAIGYDVELGSRSHGKRITRITRLERVPVGVPVASSGCLAGCLLDDDRHPQKASNGAVSGAEGDCGDCCAHTLSMHTLGEKEEKEGGEGAEVKGKGETGTTGTTGTHPTLARERMGDKSMQNGVSGVSSAGTANGEAGATGASPADTHALVGESGEAGLTAELAATPGDAVDDEEIGTCACGRPADRYTATGQPICSECVEAAPQDPVDDEGIGESEVVL